MVDDVKDILGSAGDKDPGSVSGDRADVAARLMCVRTREQEEQRRRLAELREHALAAQLHRQRQEEERRRRAEEARSKDNDRRMQVEERKRAIWEAGMCRREAMLQREREREERVERQRAARSTPRFSSHERSFAFGSSTPRMLEPADTGGLIWAPRSTNPIDQIPFYDSLALSTSNVMMSSTQLNRMSSVYDLDNRDKKGGGDQLDRSFKEEDNQQRIWSSVARRRTDLVPTIPAPRPSGTIVPGRAFSMTRLDRLSNKPIRSPSMQHLPTVTHTNARSGDTTPSSRPGSAMSNSVSASTSAFRRTNVTPRRPRPASIAGTGVNTPRDFAARSGDTTPATISRDASSTNMTSSTPTTHNVTRRPNSAPRRPRPASIHVTPSGPGEGKPPVSHRKPKVSSEKLQRLGPKATSLPSPSTEHAPSLHSSIRSSKEPSVDKETAVTVKSKTISSSQVDAAQVIEKLESLKLSEDAESSEKTREQSPQVQTENPPEVEPEEVKLDSKPEITAEVKTQLKLEENKSQQETKPEVKTDSKPEVKEVKQQSLKVKVEKSQESEKLIEKTEETDMTASMIARRITTEEQAKAALAERRRKAREEMERQAELEKLRLVREAEEEAERQRQEEERQRLLEEEARELATLQRQVEEEKLRQAIAAQQALEVREREERARAEVERQTRLKEEEEERKAREVAEVARKAEAERVERERKERKLRVEAIMLRTRQTKKAAEEAASKNETEDNKNDNTNSVSATEVNQSELSLPSDNNNQTSNSQSQSSLISEFDPLSKTSVSVTENIVTLNLTQNNVEMVQNNGDLIQNNGDLTQNNGDSTPNNQSVERNGEGTENANVDYPIIHNGHEKKSVIVTEDNLDVVISNSSGQFPLTLHNAVPKSRIPDEITIVSDENAESDSLIIDGGETCFNNGDEIDIDKQTREVVNKRFILSNGNENSLNETMDVKNIDQNQAVVNFQES